ncbi:MULTISPECIES: IS110 family transposase [unclassified Micromonospora]|uniref:IS110 family transposase n=1 Tax=unclassified Micromonospora TaxID=2617518 RepID=UPI0027DCD789|nr:MULTISPECIES: transposase [unclassified Micromonospora]
MTCPRVLDSTEKGGPHQHGSQEAISHRWRRHPPRHPPRRDHRQHRRTPVRCRVSCDCRRLRRPVGLDAPLRPGNAVGVEGTGSYGAGLARYLTNKNIAVVEVDRPDRRNQGKSDPIDAIAAARATLAGTAMGTPKTRTGPVEAIRALRVARRGAIKARTAALNQMRGPVAAAPEPLRAHLTRASAAVLVSRCAALPCDPARLHEPARARHRRSPDRALPPGHRPDRGDHRPRPAGNTPRREGSTSHNGPVRCRPRCRRAATDHRRR